MRLEAAHHLLVEWTDFQRLDLFLAYPVVLAFHGAISESAI